MEGVSGGGVRDAGEQLEREVLHVVVAQLLLLVVDHVEQVRVQHAGDVRRCCSASLARLYSRTLFT